MSKALHSLLNQTEQGKWWLTMKMEQTKFNNHCKSNNIKWSLDHVSSLLNRDFDKICMPERAIDQDTQMIRDHWKENEALGFEIAFKLTETLRNAIKDDQIILPIFYIFKICCQPVKHNEPIEFNTFCNQLNQELSILSNSIDEKEMNFFLVFNQSRYSDLFLAMQKRYEYEVKTKQKSKNTDYLFMLVLLILFGQNI